MSTEQVICPVCQAVTAIGQACWLCHSELPMTMSRDPDDSDQASPVMATLVNPYSPPVPLEEAERSSYPIMVLIIGLAIVITALAFVAPGLAVLIGVLIAPALVRTAVLVGRKSNAGVEVSIGEKSVVFLASLAGVIAACVTAVSAFLIACTATCFGLLAISNSSGGGRTAEQWIPVLLIGSALLGLAAGGWLLWRLWRRK